MGWLARLFGRHRSVPATHAGPAEAYLGLRALAFRTACENPRAMDGPHAILLETGYPNGITVTLAGYQDGTASLYFSNGGGILGAGNHAPVAAATNDWLKEAMNFTTTLVKTTEFPLPKIGRARFYVIFTDHVLTAEADEKDLGYNRHPLSPFFHRAQAVITQIRLHSPR